MNEISKDLVCISMRNGAEIWIERERAEDLKQMIMGATSHRFIKFDEQTLNTADIVGIFTAATMESAMRKRSGQWQCKYQYWHARSQKCECIPTNEEGGVFLEGTGWVY